MRKRRRPLSAEEKRLWAHVARHVKPMKGKRHPDEAEAMPSDASTLESAPPASATPSPRPKPRSAAGSSVKAHPVPLSPVPPAPVPPPLVGLERRTLQALRRRTRAVDGSIDLHGMRQEEAHFALVGFLRRAQASGHGIVLVITGKGGLGQGGTGAGRFSVEERGILRRMVPHWLRRSDLRSLVVGFEEASPHHGGSGALYVRLRRGRGAGSMDDSLW